MRDDKQKEELRKKFMNWHNFPEGPPMLHEIFDFFYSEILSRDNANAILEGALKHQREETGLTKIAYEGKVTLLEACESALAKRDDKISNLEATLEAADKLVRDAYENGNVDGSNYAEYLKLKIKSQS